MRTYNPTLAAGEISYFPGGNTFVLITATSGIDVEYLRADLTNINETATDVESGYRVTYPEGFDLIKVTNGATAQTIKFGVSRDGQGDYNIGSSLLVGGAVDTVGDIIGNRAIARNLYSVAIQQAAVVGQYATLRVVPTSGTRNLIKKVGIAIQGTSAALIRMGFSNAAFAGLGSKLVVNHDGGIYSPISSPYNGTIYGGVTTSPLSGNGLVYNKLLQANDLEFDISPHHPYIADSDNGYDFIIQCSTANVACALSVELEEF